MQLSEATGVGLTHQDRRPEQKSHKSCPSLCRGRPGEDEKAPAAKPYTNWMLLLLWGWGRDTSPLPAHTLRPGTQSPVGARCTFCVATRLGEGLAVGQQRDPGHGHPEHAPVLARLILKQEDAVQAGVPRGQPVQSAHPSGARVQPCDPPRCTRCRCLHL